MPPFDDYLKAGQSLPRRSDKTWGTRDLKKIKGVVLHQSLSSGTVSAVTRYHMGPNHISADGLPGLSYTFGIDQDGAILQAWPFEAKTWSQGTKTRAGDENEEFIAVLVAGFFRGVGVTDTGAGDPTLPQVVSVIQLWRDLKKHFNFSSSDLYGHDDFGKPACPGYALRRLIDDLRADNPIDTLSYALSGGPSVRQFNLRQLGYYIPEEERSWGILSRKALIEFQQDNGLVPDGVWGPKTERVVRQKLSQRKLT